MGKKQTPPADPRAILDDEPLITKGEFGAPADDGDDDDDEDEDEDDAEKSEILVPNLLKALDDLDGVAAASANGVSPRQRALAQKLGRGESLSKSESTELTALMSKAEGTTNTKDTFMKDDDLKKGFEVSPFLDALADKTAAAIDGVNATLAKSFADQGEFNRSLAASMNSLGAVVVEQQKAINALVKGEIKPQRREVEQSTTQKPSALGRKIKDGDRPGSQPTTDQPQYLGKSDILSTLDELIEKSDGHSGNVDGLDLVFEQSKYESTNQLSKSAMLVVLKHRKLDPKAYGLADDSN